MPLIRKAVLAHVMVTDSTPNTILHHVSAVPTLGSAPERIAGGKTTGRVTVIAGSRGASTTRRISNIGRPGGDSTATAAATVAGRRSLLLAFGVATHDHTCSHDA